MQYNHQDIEFMRHALAIAKRGIGRVAPNPSVGCVIVKNDLIIGCGRTADKGRPHAEAAALVQAGHEAFGATAYVTLEPCFLPGREGPCAQALINARVARVVIACEDPNPQVSGQGIRALKDAGIEVLIGVLEHEARESHKGFFLKITDHRPMVTLKSAISADGKIALSHGERTKITGARANVYTHHLRSRHDALLTGVGTIMADDPLLTTRLKGYKHALTRVILDTHLRVFSQRLKYKIFEDTLNNPLMIIHNANQAEPSAQEGVEIVRLDTRDLKTILGFLAQRGLTRVLVEGGAKISSAFLNFGFCDEFHLLHAPDVIGKNGLDALENHNIFNLVQDFDFKKAQTLPLGEDVLEIYKRNP